MKMENYMGPSSPGTLAGHSPGTLSTNRNSEAWRSWFGKNMKARFQKVQSGLPLTKCSWFQCIWHLLLPRARLTHSIRQASLLTGKQKGGSHNWPCTSSKNYIYYQKEIVTLSTAKPSILTGALGSIERGAAFLLSDDHENGSCLHKVTGRPNPASIQGFVWVTA